jgi:hypothetical protein
LSLLVGQYERLTPPRRLPLVDRTDSVAAANIVCAIALCGDFAQWGSATGVCHAVSGFLDYLEVKKLADLRSTEDGVLSQAVWVCLRSVPERRASECVSIIRGAITLSDYLHGDFSVVAELDNAHARETVEIVTHEPVASHLILQTLGATSARCMPSGGSAGCLTRIGLLDWCDALLTHGRQSLRREAMELMESMPPEVFLAAEWWGSGAAGCPENCVGCPASTYCRALCEQLL